MQRSLFLILILLSLSPAWSIADPCSSELRANTDCLRVQPEKTCADKIIKAYTGALYLELNKTLRGLNQHQDCFAVADRMVSALEHLPSIKGRVYRGTSLVPELGTLKVGECFSDPGFISTSMRMDIAKSFASLSGAILDIQVLNGKDVSGISAIKNESEVILLPNSPLQLQERSVGSTGNSVFKMAEVSPEECSQIIGLSSMPKSRITISQAAFGPGEALADVTDKVRAFCDRKGHCDYQVSTKFLGDPAPDRDKSFSVSWTCAVGKKTFGPYQLAIPAPATESQFDFGCGDDGSRLVSIKRLNWGYVRIEQVQVLTNGGVDVSEMYKKFLGDKPRSVFELSFGEKDLASLEMKDVPESLSVTFNCVMKDRTLTKKMVLKRDQRKLITGRLACLDI